MFGIKKTKKEVNGKNTYAVSFIGEDKMLGTDRDILTLRINSQIINFMNAYDHIDYYLAGIGDFDNLVLKVLNFYRGTDGKLAKGQCYIVNSDLECVRYEDVDPFYCPPTDKIVIDRIRKFLIEKNKINKTRFANIVKLKKDRLNAILKNRTIPTIKELYQIGENFDISFDWLVNGDTKI